MGEIEILQKLAVDLRLDLWWKQLLGQDVDNFGDFDFDKAERTLPVSENAAGKLIKEKLNGIFTFVETTGEWFLWDGIIHNPCDGSNTIDRVIGDYFFPSYQKAIELMDKAKQYKADSLRKSAAPTGDTGDEAAEKFVKSVDRKMQKAQKFEERLGSNTGTLAVLRRLQVEFSVGKDHYENDRQWFVFKNGVLDLDHLKTQKEWKFVEHDPHRNVTKYFDADLRTDVNLGHWDSFLERSVPNAEGRLFLQKVTGAAFMGITKSRMIVNLYGPPASGKSTFIDAINKLGVSGNRYCIALDKNAIVKSNDQVNFGQHDFRGRRFISVSEPDHRQAADDDFLKSVTGDESITTRGMYGKFESWTPQGILFIASNAALKINTRDTAIVERLHMIDFPNSFKEESVDPSKKRVQGLEDLLYADRSRILEWILQGMYMYAADDMQWNPPQSVVEKRGEVVANASVAVRWMHEMIDDGYLQLDMYNERHEISLSTADAFTRFNNWKRYNNERSNLSHRYFVEDIEKNVAPIKRLPGGLKVFAYLTKTDKYLKEFDTPLFIPPESTGGSGNLTF